MTPAAERYKRIQELFDAVVELPGDERAAALEKRCGGDAALRQEVEALLAADAETTSFGEQPAFVIPEDLFSKESEGQLAGRRFGVYQVIREIGRGGLGAVYLAARADDEYRKEVAIKLIRRGLDTDDILRRFRTERQILAQLDHPNIARLIDGGTTDDGLPYFVMEYVKGEPINTYCEAHELKLNERLELFRKVCAAVTYAHQNLVVHRDLKPSNILVTSEGEPKLLDFGIAKLLSSDDELLTLTAPGLRAMTPDYASPEQIKGEKITTSSDVYSLGVLLYELLAGQRPYRLKNRTPEEISRAITEQEPERPSTAIARGDGDPKTQTPNPKLLHGDLDNIVLMALRKEPERRFNSVAQFSGDIRRHLEGRPVIAHKDTFQYRTGKFVRRHKAGVFAAVLVFLTVLAGIVATLRQTQVARRERDKAQLAQSTTLRLNQFLQSLLTSANPNTPMGREVKVVEVLAAAADNVERELADEPGLLAQAHLTIARAYGNLRLPPETEKHSRRALAIAREYHGENHPATAEAMAYLGWTLQILRRWDEAEPFLRQALAVQRRQVPVKDSALAPILVDLSRVLMETGRPTEARPLVEEGLVLHRKLHGERSVEVAHGLFILGTLSQAEKDIPSAETLYRQSIAVHRTLTPMRVSFIGPVHSLATLALIQGRRAEAEPLLREVEKFLRESTGVNSATYGFALGRIGLLDFLDGDYSAAIGKVQHCLKFLGDVYPKEEPEMVLARALVGLSLTRIGQPKEGEGYLRDALNAGGKVPREKLIGVNNLESALGECLLAQGNYGEAEPLLQAGYEELNSRLGETNANTVETFQRLKQARDRMGKHD